MQVSPVEKINTYIDSTSPQTSFDQMAVMAHQQHAATNNTTEWSDPHDSPLISLDAICNTLNSVNALSEKLTRGKLLKRDD